MEVQANYIRRIEIHGLWHRYDIAWELRPDVNILSGINGVGKTTILNRSVGYLEQTTGEVKSDEKNGVHVFFDNPEATFIPYDVIRSYDRPLIMGDFTARMADPNVKSELDWQRKKYFNGTELARSPESEATYRKEWKEIIDYLYSYPCIGTWVPFNEAWGQFKTSEIAEWTKQYDPTRLVNPASGGNHYTCGDMLDLHNYPGPEMYLYDAQRATVLGEYGGIGLVLKNHLWEPNRNWGYIQFNTSTEATAEYLKYAEMLKEMIKQGFSAAVYTQTTDVEVEVNGLMTYDRKVIKLDEATLKKINNEICKTLK